MRKPWLTHVAPAALHTSCTAKFRLAQDLANQTFRFPNEDMGAFFLETIARVEVGASIMADVVRPEVEEDDEERLDLDDEDADDEDLEEVHDCV